MSSAIDPTIRSATAGDLDALYRLALATPELKTSESLDFMDRDELEAVIGNNECIFICAEAGDELVGFIFARMDDIDRPLAKHWACLVYVVVAPKWRGEGIATRLIERCTAQLRGRGVTNVYAWARMEGDVVPFLRGCGFDTGNVYRWMDRVV